MKEHSSSSHSLLTSLKLSVSLTPQWRKKKSWWRWMERLKELWITTLVLGILHLPYLNSLFTHTFCVTEVNFQWSLHKQTAIQIPPFIFECHLHIYLTPPQELPVLRSNVPAASAGTLPGSEGCPASKKAPRSSRAEEGFATEPNLFINLFFFCFK